MTKRTQFNQEPQVKMHTYEHQRHDPTELNLTEKLGSASQHLKAPAEVKLGDNHKSQR